MVNRVADMLGRRSKSKTKISVGATERNANVAGKRTSASKLAMPNNKLLNHIRARNWELAMDRLHRKPADIQDRYLFLHEALKNNPPLSLVQALHIARPDAVYHQEPAHEMMALHVACACGSPVQVVRFLHEQYQDATKHASSGGLLPLHLASMSVDCHYSVLTFLLAAYPEAIEVKDSKGQTALDYASRSGHPLSDILVRELERGFIFWSAKDVYSPTGLQLPKLLCDEKWEAALERLSMLPEESIMWSVYKGERYLPIHYACMFKAPVDVVSELAEVHPYGLELTCQDENRSALHLACHYGAHFSVIKVLLDIHVDAASYRDDLGLLPLHLACSCYAKAAPVDVWNGDAVIRAVLQAYPKGNVDF